MNKLENTKVTFYKNEGGKSKVTKMWLPVKGAEAVKAQLKEKDITYNTLVIHG